MRDMELLLSPAHLRGHVELLVNWPNFNTVVYQGIGRPEERKREGQRQVGREVRIRRLMRVWFVVLRNNYDNNIKDHWPQITMTNIIKIWDIARITKMWHTDMRWANAVGKNSANGLAQHRFATNFQFVKTPVSAKYNEAKSNKMRYVCSTFKKWNLY